MEKIEQLKEEFGEKIENHISNRDDALLQFLNLLFWKDYKAPYVDYDTRYDIIKLIDGYEICGPKNESWLEIDREKAMELANKIRENVGLPQLIIKDHIMIEDKSETD